MESKKPNPQTILETSRVRVRYLVLSDLEDFVSYRSLPEVCEFQGYSVMDLNAARDFIIKNREKRIETAGQFMQLALEHKDLKRVIGDCAIRREANNGTTGEIGISLDPKFQKQGFAKEVMVALIGWMFSQHNIYRIEERIVPENAASIALMRSLGFVYEGTHRAVSFENNKWINEMVFSLLQPEWPSK